MINKRYLYNAKTDTNREIKLINGVWVYDDDQSTVPEERLRGFHTNTLLEPIRKLDEINDKLDGAISSKLLSYTFVVFITQFEI